MSKLVRRAHRPSWSRTTGPKTGALVVVLVVGWSLAMSATSGAATAPVLGTAGSYAVLGSSTVTNTGNTVVHGNLGVSPNNAVTGFPPGTVTAPGTIHAGDAHAAGAKADALAAYNNLAGQACDVTLTGQDLGTLAPLVPGVYCFSSSAQLTGALTLDGQGSAGAVFIFKIGTTLTTASNSSVNLINSAAPCNVFWQVGESTTLGTGTDFVGNVLAAVSITATTGADLIGRLFALNGAVTLDTNVITPATCQGSTTGGDTTTGGDQTTGGDTTTDGTSGGPTTDGTTDGVPTAGVPTAGVPAAGGTTTDGTTDGGSTTDGAGGTPTGGSTSLTGGPVIPVTGPNDALWPVGVLALIVGGLLLGLSAARRRSFS